MGRPRCKIVGFDGFDPDVLANLIAFYYACGFLVDISRAPADCELLVVQRGSYGGEVFATSARACHIYDYVASGTSDYHTAFPNIPERIVISPAPKVSGASTPSNCVLSCPPVVSRLWRNNEDGVSAAYEFVHIGHRKSHPQPDPWLEQMDTVALSGNCHFWGNGWNQLGPIPQSAAHGAASLHNCQQIYRRATFALGVMYPYQRARTISGRMWQAPLNGCALFSEAVLSNAHIPGVYETSDFGSLIGSPPEPPSRAALINDASAYWDTVTLKLAGNLGLKYSAPGVSAAALTYFKWVYLRHIKAHWRGF